VVIKTLDSPVGDFHLLFPLLPAPRAVSDELIKAFLAVPVKVRNKKAKKRNDFNGLDFP
jgi:hypothetical protein